MKHAWSRVVLLGPVALLPAAIAFRAQAPGGGFVERARVALAEPFVGLRTSQGLETGLYRIAPTGVSTLHVRRAAEAFLASLSDAQRSRVRFEVEDTEWRHWANIHRFPRQGISLEEMSPAQREAAFDLLRAGLSERGYRTSRDIMRLNHHLAELVSNFEEYGEHLYYFTIMGEPSAAEPWGWQLDGHHLVVNYFVLGDQVVMTPTFMGSEPVSAESGRYAGTSILQLEQDAALALMRSLDAEQRRAATLGDEKSRMESQAEMLQDNVEIDYAGLPVRRLNDEQRGLLIDLVDAYVGNMRDGHAAIKMKEVMAHLDQTYFAWKGRVDPGGVFYYRIHSPVVFIEFDHQGPIALPGPRDVATRKHVHTVVRTPNGNDYGKDLLRQHLAAYADDPMHGHAEATTLAAR